MMSVPVGLDCCAVDEPVGLECWLMGGQKRTPARVRHCGAGSRPPLFSVVLVVWWFAPVGALLLARRPTVYGDEKKAGTGPPLWRRVPVPIVPILFCIYHRLIGFFDGF